MLCDTPRSEYAVPALLCVDDGVRRRVIGRMARISSLLHPWVN